MTPSFHVVPRSTIWSVRGHTWRIKPTANMAMFWEFCAEYTEPIATVALMVIQNQPGHTASVEKLGIHRFALLHHPLVTQVVRHSKPPPKLSVPRAVALLTVPAKARPRGQAERPGPATNASSDRPAPAKRHHPAGALEPARATAPPAKQARWLSNLPPVPEHPSSRPTPGSSSSQAPRARHARHGGSHRCQDQR